MSVDPKLMKRIEIQIGDFWNNQSEAEAAKAVVEVIQEDYRIEPKGTPIQPGDVCEGDHIRVEFPSGKVSEFITHLGIAEDFTGKVYLIDRPAPDESFVFPTGKGAIVQMKRKGRSYMPPALAFSDGSFWMVTGRPSAMDEGELRNEYKDFEIVKDGDES